MSARHRILLVDDNPEFRFLMERELQQEFADAEIRHVADAGSLDRVLADGADAAVIDAQTYWSSGLSVLQAIKDKHPDCTVIMFAAEHGTRFAVSAMKAGLDDYLVKPAACPERLPRLRRALRTCLARTQRRKSLRAADRALRKNEEHFRLALKNSPIIVFTQDRQLRYTWIYNPSLGYSAQQVLGKTDHNLNFNSREDAARLNALKRRVLESGRGTREEVRITHDSVHYYDLTIEPLRDAGGEVIGIACAALEITQRKAAEAEVARKAQLLAEAQRVAHVGSWELDLDTDTLTWSDEHYRILGMEPGAIRPNYEQGLQFVHPDDVQLVRDAIAATVMQMGGCDIEFRMVRVDGRERVVRARAEVATGADGRPARLVGTMQDITEHKQYEMALQRSEQQLRAMLAERRQLSQDLHDNILQTICAVSFSLEHSQRLIEEGHAHFAARELSWEIATLRNIMRDIRQFIRGQEPLLLSAAQLKAELAELAHMAETRKIGQFSIEVDPAAASQLMPDEARQVLSIAREAMSNSIRHAHATRGTVSLRAQDESIRFELRDDGVGFDVQRLAHDGQGLKNIAARARQIGAQIEVLSQPGHGTRVVLDLPLLARGRRHGRDRRRND
ncbi:MAG TPA: PAS domain-containing protein [Noviherbaspirillum sp.]|nr:PAS domain-containing protein [Noviherbaspirillum sp.]